MASIEKRDGKYTVRYRADGRQHRKTFARWEPANRFAREIETSKDNGSFTDPARGKVTLEQAFARFLESPRRARQPLKPRTRALYESFWRLYVAPAPGTPGLNAVGLPALSLRPVNKVTRGDIERLLGAIEARFESKKESGRATIEVVLRMVRAVLGQAVKDERLARNPASGISISAAEERAARYLSAAEVTALADAVPERDRALVLLLSFCGLRIGEAAALRVKHVDLFRQRVTVEASAGEIRRLGWQEGTTKTDERRAVFLPPFLRDELMGHLAAFTDATDPQALVFRGRDGGPLRPNNWRKRVFYPACDRVGISPRPHAHDLRHTAASLAIEAGAHPKAIQEMLGHAKIEMTLGRYGHLFDTLQEQTATRLDEIYRESERKRSAAPQA